MWTPVAPRSYPPFDEHAGLGWTLGHYKGWRTISHGGAGFGLTTFLVLLPEKQRGAIIFCNEESFAREQVDLAVIDAMLDCEPQAGPISWRNPISQALQVGGIQAAYDCFEEIKEGGGAGYLFDAYERIPLVYQPGSAGKMDLAVEVLRLNLDAFPDHAETHQLLAPLTRKLDERQAGLKK